MGLFDRFVEVGTTVIVATHEIDLVRTLGRRMVALDHGRVVDDTWASGAVGHG